MGKDEQITPDDLVLMRGAVMGEYKEIKTIFIIGNGRGEFERIYVGKDAMLSEVMQDILTYNDYIGWISGEKRLVSKGWNVLDADTMLSNLPRYIVANIINLWE